jgi:outer membrane protein
VAQAAAGSRSPELRAAAKVAVSVAFALFVDSALVAQESASPLTLHQAVQIALEKNPIRKAALADTKAAAAQIRLARSALLPKLTFTESATRGNDPVYVFGTRLRQQRFTAADFALNRLNTPLALGNFSTRFGATWTLFDSFSTWRQMKSAQQMNEASTYQLQRTEQEIVFRVMGAYYNLLLAGKQLEVAQQSLNTAHSITDRSQTRFESGLVVESDLLSAKVRLAAREQELIRAADNLLLAQAELNSAMGTSFDSIYSPAETLAERNLPMPALIEAETSALKHRPDLNEISSEQAAHDQRVAAEKSSFGPRLNAFGDWELNNPTFVVGRGGNNWVAGIELQLDLFQGGANRAQLGRQRAFAERAEATKRSAQDKVRLEVRRAYYALDASRKQVEVARAAIAQANETLRIDQNRYDSGLITITDLLGAEEAARTSQTDYWDSVYRSHISYAALELAAGNLNAQSPLVTP